MSHVTYKNGSRQDVAAKTKLDDIREINHFTHGQAMSHMWTEACHINESCHISARGRKCEIGQHSWHESCHTHERVMSDLNESSHISGRGCKGEIERYFWNESRHTYERVMSHLNESCHISGRGRKGEIGQHSRNCGQSCSWRLLVLSGGCHITHQIWVVSHIWISHVTHMQ